MSSEFSALLNCLTPHERAELNHHLAILVGRITPPERDDLTVFKRHVYRRYQHALHLDRLDRALERVTRYTETGGREGTWLLIVATPPRHGKSFTVSQCYPAWHLGRNPDHRIMLVSYGQTLANKNSRFARNIVRSAAYREIFDVELDPSSRAVEGWNIAGHEGGCDALGVLGSATGKGAHILACDDLLKNRQEAESLTIRQRVWDALNDDLLSRLEPGGAVILMATRWHQDDPTGRMLKLLADDAKRSGPVEYLRLPALAEENDPLGRAPGAALWPERYSVADLHAIRERSGPYSWAALYQQRPTPAEGGIFKRAWFDPVIAHLPPITTVVRFWDLAMSARTSADYTVGVKLGLGTDGQVYVLDVARGQIEWGDLTAFLSCVILTDGPRVAQGVEAKGYMSRAVQDLNADPRLHGYAIRGYPVDADKLTRALPVAARLSAGRIHLAAAYWNQAFIEELCAFPTGAHDDQVDALSGAWAMLDASSGAGTGDVYFADEDTFGIGPY